MKKHNIYIDSAACIGCGLCAQDCPVHNIYFMGVKAEVLSQDCIYCGHCVAVCPKAAVSITGFDEEPKEFDKKTVLNPAQLAAALQTRRSIRRFKKQTIAAPVIDAIIEAGRVTPTAKNAQDVSYLVLQNEKDNFEKIALSFLRTLQSLLGIVSPAVRNIKIDDSFLFKNAPAVIVVLCEDKINGDLAAANMALMAEAHGLGVLYNGYFAFAANHSRKLRKALGLSRKTKAATTLVLGYPRVVYHRTAPREAARVRYL